MANIGTAYIKIAPDLSGVSSKIKNQLKGTGTNFAKQFGNESLAASNAFGVIGDKLKTTAKVIGVGMAAGLGVATAGIVKISKEAVKSYSDFEQLEGGVETLFKGSTQAVMNNAAQAFKTAGISANQYMEQATSMSAALINSLHGDTKKAAEIANTAIVDMSDNANKMGTSIQSIQLAYQGFSKQNYTMLDNLKLGYGGTKTEMQRLLKDAEKMPEAMGRKFNLDNYADVVQAIHVVQQHMGVAGTTSKEAATTISGSINMLKASWSDLLTSIGGGGNNVQTAVNNLLTSFQSVVQNIAPVLIKTLPNIAAAIPQIITGIIPVISGTLPQLIPALIKGAMDIMQALINALPTIIQVFLNSLPLFIQGFMQLFMGLIQALPQIVDMFVAAMPQIITAIVSIFSNPDSLTKIVQGFMQLFIALISVMPQIISMITAVLPQIITAIVNVLSSPDNLTKIILGGIQLFLALIQAIPVIIQALAQNLPTILNAIINTITSPTFIQGILRAGVQLFMSLLSGITSTGRSLLAAAVKILGVIISAFDPRKMIEVGKNLLMGLVNGVKSMISYFKNVLVNLANDAIKAVKGIFGIHSPSRVFAEIGRYNMEGLALGIENNIGKVQDTMSKAMNGLTEQTAALDSDFSGSFESTARYVGRIENNTAKERGNVVVNLNATVKDELDIKKLARQLGDAVANA